MNTPYYSARLRQLMARCRAEMAQLYPQMDVRYTCAPFVNVDILIEAVVDDRLIPSSLSRLGEQIGTISAEGYTVRAVIKDGTWPVPRPPDLDLLISANG